MTLRITNDEITSDEVDVWAEYDETAGSWYVTDCPGRYFDRNAAITAMTLAEERARPNPNTALISSLEDELT